MASLASDVHIGAGTGPVVRVDGELRSIDMPTASDRELEAELEALMNDAQREQWKAAGRCVFVYSIAKLARFRIRMFAQHHGVGAAIRILPNEVPKLGTLGLPNAFKAALDRPSGLVLVTGPAGCGRTMSLASALLAIGGKGRGRMVSIGRPVEFDLANRLPDLTQIDLTQTAGGYPAAIREASGAGARVVAVDDASDPATMIEALRGAQQGCLVLCGLRVESTRSAVYDITERCPEGKEAGRQLLGGTLQMALGQRWIRTVRGGRTLAFEVLVATPAIRNLIREIPMLPGLYSAMLHGGQYGTQTFDQDVERLLREGRISGAEAASQHVNPEAVGGRHGDTGLEPSEKVGAAPANRLGVFAPEALEDPEAFDRVARYREGLSIVTGPPGSGRSATAAYLLSAIMARRRRHVVTIESRVEHAFEEGLNGLGPVTRHELQAGQVDLADAVGTALGEDPDVLFLGVEPDARALKLLLDAAHSGVLVLIVLPARSAVAAIEYFRDRIPASEWPLSRYRLREMFRAAFAQRLVPRVGGGRVAAYEILLGTPSVLNLVNEQRFDRLQECLETGRQFGTGMQTLAQHLSRLVEAGTVSAGDASAAAAVD